MLRLLSNLFNVTDGITTGDLQDMTRRNRFSKYLATEAYDPALKMFHNSDDTVGFMWECKPLYFAGGDTMTKLDGLFRLKVPQGTIIQFILFGDKNIDHIIEAHKRANVRTDVPLLVEGTNAFADYLKKGTEGLEAMKGIPIRNLRLFVTIKFPAQRKEEGLSAEDIFNAVQESLRSAQLHPMAMTAENYLAFMRRFFNDNASPANYVEGGWKKDLVSHWDENRKLNSQIINAETHIRRDKKVLYVGDKAFKCMTPKAMPKKVSPIQTNQLFGEIEGLSGDTNQITSEFMYTLNIVFQDMNMKIHAKANFQMTQGTIASLSTSLQAKKEEIAWATKELEDKVPFLRIMPVMWVWERKESKRSLGQSYARAWRIMEAQKYLMQEETILLEPLFIAALPFGLFNHKNTLDELERDFIAPATSITPLLPIQGDFAGGGAPVLQYIGRKGQLINIDIYGEGAQNFNALVCASAGSGKSYNMNSILKAYYGTGAKVRVVDLGDSYRKATKMYNAKYIDFCASSDICLNPFSNIATAEGLTMEDKEDIFQTEMVNIASLIMQMATSATGKIAENRAETASTLCRDAVSWAWEEGRNDACIDHVAEFLETYPKYAGVDHETLDKWGEEDLRERASIARMLAFNLKEFKSTGSFGRWFNGKANLDIATDDFVVLELGSLLNQPALFSIITTQVINAVTQDIYLSDRNTPRFLVFDEAHMFLKRDDAKTDGIAKTVNNAYRMFRKFGASCWIVTQALCDLLDFGPVGRVILNNSAYKFLLESGDFSRARDEKLIDYDDFIMYLLSTVKTNVPYYSEIFMDTPFGLGIGRLCTDRFNYYINTSSAKDVSKIHNLMQEEGLDYAEAIHTILESEATCSKAA